MDRLKTFKMPEWKPSGEKIELDEDKKDGQEDKEDEVEEDTKENDEDTQLLEALRAELSKIDTSKMTRFMPAEFEKDDDDNHHIDLITSGTNLRAWNYHLKESTRVHCRLTAGRILPALATTTACITGFVQLELYKHIKGVDLDSYRAATINLATNVYCCENLPDPVKTTTGLDQATYMQVVAIPEGFTTWDTVELKAPNATLKEFMEAFTKQHHGAHIDMLCVGKATIYNEAIDVGTSDEDLNKKLIDIYTAVCGPVFPPDREYLVFDSYTCEDASGETGVAPRIRYYFR